MSQLELRNVSKAYGSNPVVQDVSLTVEDGEFFVIVGPSGCGKSTLIRVICGLENADAGQIIISGQDVTNTPPRERNVGMVFQDYGLYPNMDVYGNIAYGMQARGMKKAEIDQRIPPVAERLGLTDMLRRSIVDLSGGEQQRVALARALAKDADIYLYDEPLSNLDPKLRGSARRDIIWGHKSKQKPSVYVTHDQIEAFAMADRIGVMGSGRMQQVGTPDEIMDSPTNLYVAQFMGSPPINMLEGTLQTENGQLCFTGDGFSLPLPAPLAAAVTQGNHTDVVLAIRPNALEMTQTTDLDGPTLSIAIDNVEPMLGETIITGKIEGQLFAAVLDDMEAEELLPGDSLSVTVPVERMLLFNGTSREAITA